MKPWIVSSLKGALAGAAVAVAMILIHIVMSWLVLGGERHYQVALPEIFNNVFFSIFWHFDQVHAGIDPGDPEMWLTFAALILGNSLVYSVLFPVVECWQGILARALRRVKLVLFSKSGKEAGFTPGIAAETKKAGVIKIAFFGFWLGLAIALVMSSFILIEDSIDLEYEIQKYLGQVFLFICPPLIFFMGVRVLDFFVLYVVFFVALFNAVRYFVWFFVFGAVWKMICQMMRRAGWRHFQPT